MADASTSNSDPGQGFSGDSRAADGCLSPGWAGRMGRILEAQCGLYEDLGGLAAEQTRCIEQEDTDGLLSILNARQGLIDQITRTNAELAPFTESWERLSAELSAEMRASLRARFERVAALVEQISRRDEADRAMLERRRAVVGKEIDALARGRGAIRAYGAKGPGVPMYQDGVG